MKRRKHLSIDFGFLLFLFVLGIIGYSGIQYYRRINLLHTIDPSQVKTFSIYPGMNSPYGEPIKFYPPDMMISEFFQSLTDSRFSLQNRDTMDSIFLEIAYKDIDIQVHIYMRSGKHKIAFGELGKWRSSSSTYYGNFQSRKLFQWYQKYSHRWLNPAPPQERS